MVHGFKLNQMGGKKWLSSVVALAVLSTPVLGGILYLRSAGDYDAGHEADPVPDTLPHAQHGDWSLLAASKLDGSRFAMVNLAGKPVVLYFWATWCPQCQVQRKVLKTLAAEWGDRLWIVALSADDDVESLQRYLGVHATLPHELRASHELLHLFDVEGLPTLVVIDAGGRVQSISVGLTEASELGRLVAPLLS